MNFVPFVLFVVPQIALAFFRGVMVTKATKGSKDTKTKHDLLCLVVNFVPFVPFVVS